MCQKLSEEFIRKSKDQLDWVWGSMYQKLSEELIREFKNNVFWYNILLYQKLSKEFIIEFNLEISEKNWLYKSSEYKMEQIKECGLYEIDGDYIIAYKSTREYGYSIYNFQYKYEVGESYTSHCDCNINHNDSFGFSAWTKKNALEYYDKGELYKVISHIDNLGALAHKSGKLRFSKIEILEKI